MPDSAGNKTSLFWPLLKCEVKNSAPVKGLFQDLALYKSSLKIAIQEVVGYKTSLFKISTPKWLLIRPYGDFVSGLITSPLYILRKLSFRDSNCILRLTVKTGVRFLAKYLIIEWSTKIKHYSLFIPFLPNVSIFTVMIKVLTFTLFRERNPTSTS